jgi:hypothetical protein
MLSRWPSYLSVDPKSDRRLEVGYTYDALGRRAARDDGSTAQGAHYGDLTDVPILDGRVALWRIDKASHSRTRTATRCRRRSRTKLRAGAVRPGITTLADEEAGIVSRQSYDPDNVYALFRSPLRRILDVFKSRLLDAENRLGSLV